jgi:hypothetical protein
VDTAHDEDTRVISNLRTEELATFEGLERWLEKFNLIRETLLKTLESCLDLSDIEDGPEIPIIQAETLGNLTSSLEAIAFANWECGGRLTWVRHGVNLGTLAGANELTLCLELAVHETSIGKAKGSSKSCDSAGLHDG